MQSPEPDVVPSGVTPTLAELGNALLVAELAARSPMGQARPEARHSIGAWLVALVWEKLNGALAVYSEAGRAEVLSEITHVVGTVLNGTVPSVSVVKSLRARG